MAITNQLPIKSLTVGGKVFTDLENLIVLRIYMAATASTYFMYKSSYNGTPAGIYQVTAGKSFYIHAARFYQADAASNNATGKILQSDTNSGSGTNLIGAYTQAASGVNTDFLFNAAGPTLIQESAMPGKIAAQKYVACISGNGGLGWVELYGYEL